MSQHNSSNVFRIQPIAVKRAKIFAHTKKTPAIQVVLCQKRYSWVGEKVTEHFRTYKINT